MTIEEGAKAATRLLDAGVLPTAVFCTNDLLALGAERALLARGLRVPRDIAIAGYDDIRFAATSLVPLTTVRNPAFELGYQSTQLLIEEAADGIGHKHRRLLFEPELVRAHLDRSRRVKVHKIGQRGRKGAPRRVQRTFSRRSPVRIRQGNRPAREALKPRDRA